MSWRGIGIEGDLIRLGGYDDGRFPCFCFLFLLSLGIGWRSGLGTDLYYFVSGADGGMGGWTALDTDS